MQFETHAWVALPNENTVAIYNVYSDTLIATISVGLGPIYLTLTPDGTKVYVSNRDSNTVSVICTATNRVIATIPVGTMPADIAIDPTSTIAYVKNFGSNNVTVIDIPTDTVRTTISVGNSPTGIAMAPDGRRLYVANSGDNTVSVIDPATNTVIATVSVGLNPFGVAVSPDNTKVYVVNNVSNNVSVFNAATNTVVTTIPVGSSPFWVTVNPATPFAYVSNTGSNSISVISTATDTVTAVIAVGTAPAVMAVTSDGAQLWVANQGNSTISIINTATNAVTTIISVSSPPLGITIGRVGSAFSPSAPIDLTDPYQLKDVEESVCIIAEKVFASCQQRECFPVFLVPVSSGIAPFTFVSMTFGNGVIVPGSETITPIPARPNFARVQLTVSIPYTLTLRDATGALIVLTGTLPDIVKDIVLYYPPTRPEFVFTPRIETRSELLSTPILTDATVQLAIGVFVIAKVTGLVQMLVPAFGYCPEPPMCEDYSTHVPDPCQTFIDPNATPFPTDFFPLQLDDAACVK